LEIFAFTFLRHCFVFLSFFNVVDRQRLRVSDDMSCVLETVAVSWCHSTWYGCIFDCHFVVCSFEHFVIPVIFFISSWTDWKNRIRDMIVLQKASCWTNVSVSRVSRVSILIMSDTLHRHSFQNSQFMGFSPIT
jgi:hypothetical protein